jgi:hypothetical protein
MLRVIAKGSLLIVLLGFYKSTAFTSHTEARFFDFEWPELLFIIMLSATAAISWAGVEGAAIRNVVHLVFAKPFLLGDIVHLNGCQSPGGNGASITGFVENITFSSDSEVRYTTSHW